MKLSTIANSVAPSLTRRLFNLAKNYPDVIDFTLGDPDVQPNDAIKKAACTAINNGKTRYSQNAGLLELRQAICKKYKSREGLKYEPNSECIVTVGAMEGLFLALLALLDNGDEVVIPAPYYVNYVQMVQLCRGVPVITGEESDNKLEIDIEKIKRAITPKTKAIILNSPANPSGKVVSQEKIKKIAELAIENDLVVISDEVYKCLIYDNCSFKSIVSYEGMRERTILVNSFSKEFCMTGYRIGYVLAPHEIIDAMVKLQENICACAPLPSQYAAIEAFSSKTDYSENMKKIFSLRRNQLVYGINKISGLSCITPEATFYLMVDISKTNMNSIDFAERLLESVHVAVVPGIAYGKNCDGYVRIAFTLEAEKIEEGLKRINSFMVAFLENKK